MPDAIRLGANVASMPISDQGRESLDPSWTLSEALTGGRGDTVMIGGPAEARGRLHEGFSCRAEQVRTPLRRPAGRRARPPACWRAPLGKNPRTCWCWTSRPTISTRNPRRARGDARDYASTVILISHDRDSSTAWSTPSCAGRR